ncbi:MAG TPA: CRTAC1 family protein [Vicinamibacteria bacterium]|nr:CRTAC1 family protein [Vicinamibacteria bacterium]
MSLLLAVVVVIASAPVFEPVQPELFSEPGAQPNAWADFDNDGDLDLYVGMRYGPNRLYRNDSGAFRDVAGDVGLDVPDDTRVAAWGDFDGDGHLDLYIGFPFEEGRGNRLYRNDGDGRSFSDVAPRFGVDAPGVTRQASFIDYDNDGDLDLFVAFRDRINRLFRNDGERFTDVSESSGIGDRRRSVGVAWFDMDEDGDLDSFVANQNGDNDGLFRNDGGRFVDVARDLRMDGGERSEEIGGVGPAVVDYDNDGHLDLFVAMYGPDVLFRNEGGGRFTAVDAGPVNDDYHSTSAAWGDYDNDGWSDLFVVSYLSGIAEVPDHLYRNVAGRFENVTPELVLQKGASHGVQWADFDGDGDLDLALANNHPDAGHPLYRNILHPEASRRSLQVFVGRPGSEVRVFRPGTREVLGSRLVDTGGGYCSQNVTSVHFGLGPVERVDVEVTTLGSDGRHVTRIENVEAGAGPALVVEPR